MTNLKVNDIEILETLSLDELDQVVGGRGRDRSKWFGCNVTSVIGDGSTFNEPFFPGHIPGRPLMPGVLLEAMQS